LYCEGHENLAMKHLDDDAVKPFTPVPANRIRISDFLRYVATHQDAMEKYKEEFLVRS